LFGYPNSQLFVSSNMASKLLQGVLSMTLIAHEQPIFQPYKLAIAVKFVPASTSILDRIGSQYMWYPISSCAKLYRRFIIKRSFIRNTHNSSGILGPACLLHSCCRRIHSAPKSLLHGSQRTLFPSQTPYQQKKRLAILYLRQSQKSSELYVLPFFRKLSI
jgi:hypothetical protein